MITTQDFWNHHGCYPFMVLEADRMGCKTMRELWGRGDLQYSLRKMIARCPGVLSPKDARLFAVWGAMRVIGNEADSIVYETINCGDRFANGESTKEELDAARDKIMPHYRNVESIWPSGTMYWMALGTVMPDRFFATHYWNGACALSLRVLTPDLYNKEEHAHNQRLRETPVNLETLV